MKSIILSALVALMVLAAPVFADVAVGEVGASASPGDQAPRICIDHRDVIIGTDANPPGVNPFDYRTSLYAFTGEQIEYDVIVRDPNGVMDIGFVKAIVGGQEEVIASEISFDDLKDDVEGCDGFGEFNNKTDKAFRILISVEPDWYGDTEVVLAAYNSAGQSTEATHSENWFFNPAISIDVSTSDGLPIHFEEMPYGADTPEERTVHSLNKIKVKNTAEGGVNLWMFVAGTDLYDPSGASSCWSDKLGQATNYIAIEEYMWYRGWSGTQWTSWEGWTQMSKYDQNAPCRVKRNLENSRCYGGKPVPYDPSVGPRSNLLTNQGTLEIEFKLQYPMPCIGTFSQGSIYVFGKAV